MWAHARKGYTYRTPDGHLGYMVVDTKDSAESTMAFAHKASLNDGHCSGISIPTDVAAAYAAGWTIVPVEINIVPVKETHRSTQAYRR